MIRKISTAWLQLKYEKIRLLVALCGISFAVVLIFMQLGLRAALFDSAVAVHTRLQGEIFLSSPRSTSFVAMENFPERRLDQALALDEVESVVPIYLGFTHSKNPHSQNSWRTIYVIGFDIGSQVFNLPGVESNIDKIQLPDVVLFDEASRAEFGPIADDFRRTGIVKLEVGYQGAGTRTIKVLGLFKLGTSFGVDGNLITSDLNFLRIVPQRQKGFINLGVIKLKAGYDTNKVVKKLREYLPKDVKILSKQAAIDAEKNYWNSNTPIGFIFAFGVVLGIIVGMIIVYQILYSNVSEHLAEYATLKAIGYKHNYLLSVIFQESLILAILSYLPGFLISSGMYKLTSNATHLPIAMEPTRVMLVLVLTFSMCFISGVIAMRKLAEAEPADIF
jgi:putative ABC transport system permease protein